MKKKKSNYDSIGRDPLTLSKNPNFISSKKHIMAICVRRCLSQDRIRYGHGAEDFFLINSNYIVYGGAW